MSSAPSSPSKQASKELSATELQAYREAFSIFDHDGDGAISTKELHDVMKSLGQSVTDTEIQDMINEVDSDHNGTVDFDEFVKMMTIEHKGIDIDAELREAFNVFDADRSGSISKDEIFKLMNSLGENITKDDVDQMLAEVDKDGDGSISYEEFVSFIKDNK